MISKIHINRIKKLPTLNYRNSHNVCRIANKLHPEWGVNEFKYDEANNHTWVNGYTEVPLLEEDFHNWVIVRKKNYSLTDVDSISSNEDGTLIVYFKDETEVETGTVNFLPNGLLSFDGIIE